MEKIKNVYVVDDSTIMRLFIIDALKDIQNIAFFQFGDGEELLNTIKKEQPDLIILDSVMPKKNGIEVLETIKESGLLIPIIFCSADIQTTTRNKVLSLGVVDFIEKPLKKQQLNECVKKIILQTN